ncbi:ABC transporter substrate-binding protein, partial [Azospirillum brasilense]|uniref:ABC transporter substrate-binding protein n=1 Tax=Azospirillum brasilense TaxID=192 RepID=UPI0024948EB2
MTLEPPGLDPTSGAASAIGEITLYNVFETLTRINPDGSTSPLLAERWDISPDLKTLTFHLRRGVKFHNGAAFNAEAVKYSFDRAAVEKSTNKDKRTFANLTAQVVDEHTVTVASKEADPDLLFLLGQATAECGGQRRAVAVPRGQRDGRPLAPGRELVGPRAHRPHAVALRTRGLHDRGR